MAHRRLEIKAHVFQISSPDGSSELPNDIRTPLPHSKQHSKIIGLLQFSLFHNKLISVFWKCSYSSLEKIFQLMLPKDVAEWLAQEIPDSNLGPKTDYND
jgi:hypothetical protein